MVGNTVFVAAYAKVNLTLDVLGKRGDGYHRLTSVLQTIALHDALNLRLRDDAQITFTCDVAELSTADNLVVRAAHLLRKAAEQEDLGVEIELNKHIPVQAGLGGGSSDGASALTALNTLWNLRLPHVRLMALAAELGSDVPFFLTGGTALIEGRGEIVTPLPDAEPLWFVLVKPAIAVPTVEVFRRLLPEDYTDGTNSTALVAAIQARAELSLDRLTNTLEPAVLRQYAEVRAVKDVLNAAGALHVLVSGSGSTLYAPFRHLAEASTVYHAMRDSGHETWLTYSVAASA
ncbi:MAG: 4-diphosphocytidyl-2-C-methyl-D-erythritol kinase [Ktedonobacterales bacterium]|jgi:4-diphosphocytidyl-2-C-methyl-D-erythritol kinase|nr:MAG: 4-diphosphocytidyl-2-C-methyl-D-erythritol kinase [Ktedonobacterales bacterium]